MRVVGLHAIEAFGRRHADAKRRLEAWIAEARDAEWEKPQDVKNRYPNASILSGNRVVFNIKGNSYRLVVRISYPAKVVRIERIGTHAEYDSWNL